MLKQPLTKMDSSKHIVMGIASRMATQKKKKKRDQFQTTQPTCNSTNQLLLQSSNTQFQRIKPKYSVPVVLQSCNPLVGDLLDCV